MRRGGASKMPASHGWHLADNSFNYSAFGAISAVVPLTSETTSLAFRIKWSTYL
jgi:hypothetical protein